MKYLKQFIVGSSWIVTFPFFYRVGRIKKKYSYYNYTLIAPLWIGLWNIISFIIKEKLNISMKQRFLLMTFITYSLSIILVKYTNAYNYTEKEWKKYYARLFLLHFCMWNIVICNIEENI